MEGYVCLPDIASEAGNTNHEETDCPGESGRGGGGRQRDRLKSVELGYDEEKRILEDLQERG